MGLGSQGFTPLIRERYRERQTAAPRYSRVRGMRDRTKGRLSLIWLLAERVLPVGIHTLDRRRDILGQVTGEYPNFLRIFFFFACQICGILKKYNFSHLLVSHRSDPHNDSSINAGRSPFFPCEHPGCGEGVAQVSCPGSFSPAVRVSARLPLPRHSLVLR